MKAQIVEQVEFFSEAELQSLEFSPEELEAIEAERVPDLDSISFEDIAEDLEAALETGRPTSVPSNPADINNKLLKKQRKLMKLLDRYKEMSEYNPIRKILKIAIRRLQKQLGLEPMK